VATVSDIVATAEELWPLANAEAWDAPGLVAGHGSQQVFTVMLSVDVTADVVEAARASGAQLLLSHHPFIMRGVTTLSEHTSKGATLASAIKGNLSIYSAHTNADVVEQGVSDTLAKAFGLENPAPLSDLNGTVGIGRIGTLSAPSTLGSFARLVAGVLPATAAGVRVAGDYNQMVQRIALCGGAGDSLIGAAIAADADVYVTADLRHHVVQDAREQALLQGGKPAIIDVSHWASEYLWLEVAARQLRKLHPDVSFEVCDLRTDPWDFLVTQ